MQLPGAVDVVGETGTVARFAGVSAELLQGGIDDLAKYRVIVHLLQHPRTMADPTHYATNLGFHSVSRTETLLQELWLTGILIKQEAPDGRITYGLLPDSELRRRLRECCVADPASPGYEVLLRRLAQRSVARAKEGLRQRKKAS